MHASKEEAHTHTHQARPRPQHSAHAHAHAHARTRARTRTHPRSFYPATVYLSTSKLAVAVCGNLAFASALLTQSLVIKVRRPRRPPLLGASARACVFAALC